MQTVKDSPEIVTVEKELRVKSRATSVEECDRLKIWDKLKSALTSQESGIGLAAVQIGYPIRAALSFLPTKDGEVKEVRLINPTLHNVSQFATIEEGCLSFPGKFLKTSRAMRVVVVDEINGQFEYTGLAAVVAQHEVDHMDGILFSDRTVKSMRRRGRKVGRNDPCPCGSGKKHKRCCV